MWPFDKEKGYVKNITRFLTIIIDLIIINVLLSISHDGYKMVFSYFHDFPDEAMIKYTVDTMMNNGEYEIVENLSNFVLITLFIGFLIQIVLLYAYITWMWCKFATTPGKFLFGVRILDARTMKNITFKQASIRFFGIILSFIPLGLGIIWSAFDRKSRAWHDRMANTAVIMKKTER